MMGEKKIKHSSKPALHVSQASFLTQGAAQDPEPRGVLCSVSPLSPSEVCIGSERHAWTGNSAPLGNSFNVQTIWPTWSERTRGVGPGGLI